MAKLDKMPDQHIIDGFKKSIDFYEWMGIPVARKWPRSPGHLRAPAVMEQWAAWSYIAKAWGPLPQDIKDAYAAMVVGTDWTPRDLFTRGYLSGFYRYPHSRPEELSTTYWKDTGPYALTASAKTTAQPWTSVDVQAATSKIAKFVILQVLMISTVSGVAGASKLEFRKPGTTPSDNPQITTHFSQPNWTYANMQIILALDENQCFEYKYTPATTSTVYYYAGIMGWIE